MYDSPIVHLQPYEFFVVGPQIEDPRIHVELPVPYSYDVLCGVLEEKLGMALGGVEEVRAYNMDTGLWDDITVVGPSAKAKLWVRYSEGPPMLTKELVPTGSKEFNDCRSILDNYVEPYKRSQQGCRVLLTKVEQLTNPQCEHVYQIRRRQLADPENVALVCVGGDKKAIKSMAARGFELPTEISQFGRGAMVFGSNIKSVGAEGMPSPMMTNKLLICEAALGVPLVVSDPVPTMSYDDLTAQGHDAVVLPAISHDDVEYTVLYHPHQAAPRYMLTYTIELTDPSTLCSVSGEPFEFVSKKTGTLECMKCVLLSPQTIDQYEQLKEAVKREKLLFATKQDDLSVYMGRMKATYGELEDLNMRSTHEYEALVDGIMQQVKQVTEKIREAGLKLIDEAKAKHHEVRGKLDKLAIDMQNNNAKADDLHEYLSTTMTANSDVHFQRGLHKVTEMMAKVKTEPVQPRQDPDINNVLHFLQTARVDVSAVIRECSALTLSSASSPDSSHSPPSRARSLFHSLPEKTVSYPPSPGSERFLERPPPPAVEPLVPPMSPPKDVSWVPPEADIDPSTVLTTHEAFSPMAKRVLLVFGKNDSGQLGVDSHGNLVERPVEVALSQTGSGSVSSVATGEGHTLCTADDGRVYAFGKNTSGQLGLGHRTSISTPTPVYSLSGTDVLQLACGAEHSVAVTVEGTVYCWGLNDVGQLGLGHIDRQETPNCVTALEGQQVISVAAGARHTVCLTSSGLVYTWGCNKAQQLGIGSSATVTFATVPQKVAIPAPIGSQVVKIAVGAQHSVAMVDNGMHVYVWGRNDDGRLGLGHDTVVASPRLLASLCNPQDPICSVGAGTQGSLALTQSGRVIVWGTASSGILTTIPKPYELFKFLNIHQAAMGTLHIISLTADGRLFTTGGNHHGQLGLHHHNAVPTPGFITLPPSIRNTRHRVTAVASGPNHTFVIVSKTH